VSHELRTPLTNIRMFGEMLSAELPEDDARAQAHAHIIVEESQRLGRLIGNVLAFARESKGTLRLEPRRVSLDDVVREVLAQFQPLLAAKGVAVEATLAAPTIAELDADVVTQVLGNLLGNVEKYAANGGRVEVRTAEGPGQRRIDVHDGGPGIPPVHAERIFEPFFRLQDRPNAGVSGTGIGLGIARDLARLHGGDLVLVPAEGACAGAHFCATLRVEEATT